MDQLQQPQFQFLKSHDYRESYANSVQVRVSTWDFFLTFGINKQEVPEKITIENMQGIYLSPQQAKALLNVLAKNVAQYEQAFGEIALEQLPQADMAQAPVN